MEAGRWMDGVGMDMGVWEGVPWMYTHAHVKHDKHGMPPCWQPFANFYTCIHVHVCMCMHSHACAHV